MIDRLAVDSVAAIDYMRDKRQSPPLIDAAREVVLPLTVLGELFFGAQRSKRSDENREFVDQLAREWYVLVPDIDTARIYGEIRALAFAQPASLTASKVNDLWIAAICIQHGIPLLTNDAGFDHIPRVQVVHW
jgi:tRNA(fMet)-specific endonuclease VapC